LNPEDETPRESGRVRAENEGEPEGRRNGGTEERRNGRKEKWSWTTMYDESSGTEENGQDRRASHLPDLTRLPRPTLMNTASFGRSATAMVSHGAGQRGFQLQWLVTPGSYPVTENRTERDGTEQRGLRLQLQLLLQLLLQLQLEIQFQCHVPTATATATTLQVQLHSSSCSCSSFKSESKSDSNPIQTASSAPAHSPSFSSFRRYAVSLVFGRVHTSTSHTLRKSAKEEGERVE
jgi:hypothetical protein